MRVNKSIVDGIVNLEGKLYSVDTEVVRKYVLEAMTTEKDVTIDISKLEYLDSAAIGMFIRLHKNAAENGIKIVFKGAKGHVAHVFELTKLNQVFTMIN